MTASRANNLTPRSAIHSRRASAFTLLELVLAMALVGLLIVPLYQSLQSAYRAKAAAEASLEPARTAELTFEFIRQDLENAVPPGGVLAGSFVGTDSTGNGGRPADDLQFFTTADSPDHPDANGEIKNVELTIAVPNDTTTTTNGRQSAAQSSAAQGQPSLVRNVIRNLLTEVQVTPDQEVVCRGVSGFNLRYFDGSDWQDNWDSSQQDNELPLAVEVTIELDRPNRDGTTRTYRYLRVFPIAAGTNQGGLGL